MQGKLNEQKWIQPPKALCLPLPFIKARAVRPLPDNKMEYEVKFDGKVITLAIEHTKAQETSTGKLYEDMCQMTVLNEPEVLNNLVKRYNINQIFTYIGHTLLIVNPYQLFKHFFSKEAMLKIRDAIIANDVQKLPPHVYMIAGKAYRQMIMSQSKQAIVIAGESGAGKTESTKYCMQLLTSLSHKEACEIQGKILACNPLLEAFGNSKTVRNDNSSRFGKYVQIFFGSDNIIEGASINSYLLEKSRVVSISLNQRSFHIFYCVTAAKIQNLQEPSHYAYLNQSKCYTANQNDEQYFHEVSKSMDQIGFTLLEKNTIWKLLSAILNLGNIQFDDTQNKDNQSKPCKIQSNKIKAISGNIGINEKEFERILLFEKKKFLKEFTHSAYNKNGCISNRNTISKAIYNAIFEFILYKIEISLRPKQIKKFNSINILDIFGFQNFAENSFQQLCINFTNQKLLKLYNKYVFEREMELLKQDGLSKQLENIKPPTNQNIIQLMSGNLSLFSIINDLTMPQQFKDQDMVDGFKSKITDIRHKHHLEYDLHHSHKFLIKHSQCEVMYSVNGFKSKNQDKVNSEIQQMVKKLFENEDKQNIGKTMLSKFQKNINDLMTELVSSNVHFIRCIKPNEKKMANLIDEHYLLSQVRYLGVFETIQIRKKTFPSRKSYGEFIELYKELYPKISEKDIKKYSLKILQEVSKDQKNYMLGEKRVYVSNQIENELNKKLYILMKVKNQKAKIIQRKFKQFRFKKYILTNLKVLVSRIRLWRKIAVKLALQIQRKKFQIIKNYSHNKKIAQLEQERKAEEKRKLQEKRKNNQANQQKNSLKLQQIPLLIKAIEKLPLINLIKLRAFNVLKQIKIKNLNDQTFIVPQPERQPYPKNPHINKVETEVSEHKLPESFLNEQSFYSSTNNSTIFKKTLTVGFFVKQQSPKLEKLRMILGQKYKMDVGDNEQDFFSPNSGDCHFEVEQTEQSLLNKIISFSTIEFFKDVLRKRTNFIGIRRSDDDILTAKPRPMSKSLTYLNENDEEDALKVFRILVKIGQQAKLQNVFKLIQNMIELCKGGSQELKNQVFLMLLKQSNTTSQLSAIRIFQCLSLFLHIYSPDQDFIFATLNIFFNKLAEKSLNEKQEEYVRYLYKKLLRMIERPFTINYMPTKYQMMALMCKRQISVPVYLPIGNSILLRVQSYETFADVKVRVMDEFGINHTRLHPNYFTFFQIVNFEHEDLGESPINQNQNIWDVMTYWQKAKEKYKQSQIVPPAFFLMLKARYAYECMQQDQETIQLFFAQCYFDYFIGRIKLSVDKMGMLAACVKKIKMAEKFDDEIIGTYPTWVIKDNKKQNLVEIMRKGIKILQKQKLNEILIKYRFLSICDESPLALALAIPTDQPIKMFMKPRMFFFTEKCQILESFSIRSIVKWAVDKQKFVFEVRGEKEGKNRSLAVFTEHASICSSYLALVSKLIQNANKLLQNT